MVGQLHSRWLFSNVDCSKEASLVHANFYMKFRFCFLFWLETLVALIQNHASARDCFQAFEQCHLKWLCCFISEQRPFSRTGRQSQSAAWAFLHRIPLGTCWFVPVHYFNPETLNDRKVGLSNEYCFGLQDSDVLAKSIEFHFSKKEPAANAQIYSALKPFWLSSMTVAALFPTVSLSLPALTVTCSGTPVFVLTPPTLPSCAGALFQEYGHWFCSQNLLLSSENWLK